jgi:hypothetical protein
MICVQTNVTWRKCNVATYICVSYVCKGKQRLGSYTGLTSFFNEDGFCCVCELGNKIMCEYTCNEDGSQFSQFMCRFSLSKSKCYLMFKFYVALHASNAVKPPPPSPPTYTTLASNFLAKSSIPAVLKFRHNSFVQVQHLKSQPEVRNVLLLQWLQATYIHLIILIFL